MAADEALEEMDPNGASCQEWAPFSYRNFKKITSNFLTKQRILLQLWHLARTTSATFGQRKAGFIFAAKKHPFFLKVTLYSPDVGKRASLSSRE